MKNCKHQDIIITTKTRYYIPKGWEWLWEQEDKDLADFCVEEEQTETFCQDCGRCLE